MTVNRCRIRIILLCSIMVCAILAGCNNSKSQFTGSKTCNDDHFLVDFDVLNSTVEGEVKLKAGEKINVVIAVEKGSIDVSIVNDAGKTIYKGDDAETSSFTVEADIEGKYTCSVSGSDAKGSVHFIKVGTE